MAGSERDDFLTDGDAPRVRQVLWRVLALNLIVAVAKLILGWVTGAVSILSDGIHSLTDSASNVVALAAVRLAHRPPDDHHPYGHRKFETMASMAILVFLLVVLVEVLQSAIARLRSPSVPDVNLTTFAVMAVTFVINIFVVWYERRAGRRLRSPILLADAHHTMSDVLTTATVMAALVGVLYGVPWLDPLAALVVAGFIAAACWEIFRDTTAVLSDHIVIPESEIRKVIEEIPEVIGCHQIRTRGGDDFVFLDLHAWLNPTLSLDEAHRLSHVVKDRLMAAFPQIKDAVIHIEPPPGA